MQHAYATLPRGEWDYLIGGAETEASTKRNRLAFERLALKARVLTNVSNVQARRKLLGVDQRIPVLLAPIGSLQVFEPGGALTAAIAAERFGVMQIVSSVCQPDFETLIKANTGPKIYQYYVHTSEADLIDAIQRSITAGYRGFCLTVDSQVYSRRERDLLKRYLPMSQRRAANAPPKPPVTMQAALDWPLVERMRKRFDIPLILKGIACAEDALLAVEHGIDIIYVSNHGGRQLDHACGALDTLPAIARAVAGRASIVVDGGILRGTDVIKALALGADAVAIGRLQGAALAAGGAPALERALELLEIEIRANLALMGLASIDQLDADCVIAAEPVNAPHVWSGFPLLAEGYGPNPDQRG